MQQSRGSHIVGRHLVVDGEPFFVRGAEIQYFRLSRQLWERHLRQARLSGFNTVTACMPWHFHEPNEGEFDFVGKSKSERDLSAFIRLVAENDLKLIVHPGPFMNCEFRTGGIPEWLFRKHPETMSHRADGAIATGRPIPAEGEPLYREYVKKWYDAVVPLFAKNQADKGGPIILFQPDNELSAAWSFGLLNSLYDPNVIGHFWPDWLEAKYHDIESYNRAIGHNFSDFRKVEPPRSFPNSSQEKLISYDWLEFKRCFFADWGTYLAKLAKNRGMNTPFIFNEPVAGFYGHGDHAGFGNAQKRQEIEGVSVSHAYSDRIFDLSGLVSSLLGIELVKSSPWGGPPMAVEINCNWYAPRCSASAINWSPLLRSNLAHGLRGFSIFTYSEGIADLEDSINGPEYFENTCLDINACPSNTNALLESFNRLLDTWGDSIKDLESVPDLTIAYSPAMRIVDFLGAHPCLEGSVNEVSGPGGESFDTEPGLNRGSLSAGHDWLDGYENVSKQTISAEAGLWLKLKESFALLSRLNLQFDLLELTNPVKIPGKGCLIVPCTGTLEEQSITYLLEHIEKGGRCLFFPTIPTFTTSGKADHRISERLGIGLIEQIRPAGSECLVYGAKAIDIGNSKAITETGWLFVHRYPEGSEILASADGKPVVAKVGNVIVSGIDARFTTGSTLKFWKSVLLEKLAISATIESSGNFYYACLLGTAEKGLLTVANITGNTSAGKVSLSNGDLVMTLELGETEARCLPINLALDGVKLRYSTSEIQRSDDGLYYELHGCPGTRGCIAFVGPTTFFMDGTRTMAEQRGQIYVVEYTHQIIPIKIAFPSRQ